VWREASAKAGVKMDMYCLRHSMLTDRVNDGVNILSLAHYTGTSVSQLENTYYKARLSALEEISNLAKPEEIEMLQKVIDTDYR